MEPIQQINRSIDTAKHTRWAVYGFIGLFIVSGLIFAYNRFAGGGKVIKELESHVAAELPKASKVKKTTVKAPATLEVYHREDLLGKVPVAPEISQNKANQFTSTAVIPKMPHGGQAVAFTNVSTGKSGIAIQANPRPLFGFGGKTQIGAVAGVTTRGNLTVAYVGQPVVRVGPVNVGVVGGGGTLGSDGVLGCGLHISGEF